MPFPSEHAARQREPDDFEGFRRTHPQGWPDGLEAIWGITDDGGVELQSVRADASLWTPDAFRSWLDERGLKSKIEEAASKAWPMDMAGKW